MKAILVIDKPKSCNECQLKYVHLRKDSWYCCLTNTEVEYECNMEIIDKNCPLKPLPQKKDFFEEYMKVDRSMCEKEFDRVQEELRQQILGYNICIDEILGEEE